MVTIKPHSLEEAFLFLTQAVRAGEGGDPRAADWLALGLKTVAKHVNAIDPKAGTAGALVTQMLVHIGKRFPREDQYLQGDDIRSGWVQYVHKDGRHAICRKHQATFAEVEPGWSIAGPISFQAD